jgi:putative membrane protein
MKKSSIIFLAAFGLLFAYSCENKNQNQETTTQDQAPTQQKGLSNNDREFIKETAQDGILEVELGKLANQKASSQEVKDLAHHMMMDHQKANNELKQLASSKNVMLPDSLDKDAQDKIQDLAKLTGKEFDKKYIDRMVKEHKEDLKDFEDVANNSEDTELKSWAQETIPTLRNHYTKAQSLDSIMSTEKKKSTNKTSMR